MDKKKAYKALSEAVEVLEDAGLTVGEADVQDIPEARGNPLAALMGGQVGSTKKPVIIIDDFEEFAQEHSDGPDRDPDEPMDEEETVEVTLDDLEGEN